jgi:cell division septal protein FtsQ
LGLGGAVYVAGIDAAYYVTDVQVAGATTLSQRAVVDASGMDGMHIFWLDPAEAAERVAAIPSVLSATVEISWPNRAGITVVERTPVMVWDQAGDRFWVDENGQLMQARQESSDLLLILSQQPEKLYVGERIPIDVLAGAMQLRQERPNIASLFYEWGNGLSYEDGRNWRAYFGTGLDMNQKLVVYEAIVANLQERGMNPKYVSVINKDKPFYRLAEPTE